MFMWVKKLKDRRAAAAQAAEDEHRKGRDRALAVVADRRKTMLEKPCPFRNGEKCVAECIHFKEGYVFYAPMGTIEIRSRWWYELPKCKL